VDQLQRRLRQLRVGAGRKLRLDHIARDQHRAHSAASRAADISRLQPMLGSHQSGDGAMFAVGAQRTDDCGRDEAHHPAGWK
jgi:hypothetical protein